jgi:hypothetical protein
MKFIKSGVLLRVAGHNVGLHDDRTLKYNFRKACSGTSFLLREVALDVHSPCLAF